MIQQENNEFPVLKCNKDGHENANINILCLRLGCNETPAQCHFCTLRLH